MQSGNFSPHLSFLDRWLTLWIFVAMAGSILLGWVFPTLPVALDAMSVGTFNLPIAIRLMLLMHAPFAKVRYEELPRVLADRRVLVLSLVQNWVIVPGLLFALAVIFMRDHASQILARWCLLPDAWSRYSVTRNSAVRSRGSTASARNACVG